MKCQLIRLEDSLGNARGWQVVKMVGDVTVTKEEIAGLKGEAV